MERVVLASKHSSESCSYCWYDAKTWFATRPTYAVFKERSPLSSQTIENFVLDLTFVWGLNVMAYFCLGESVAHYIFRGTLLALPPPHGRSTTAEKEGSIQFYDLVRGGWAVFMITHTIHYRWSLTTYIPTTPGRNNIPDFRRSRLRFTRMIAAINSQFSTAPEEYLSENILL